MAESPNGAYAADESLVGPMAKLERRAGLIDKLLREIEAWEQARPYTARWSSDDVSSSLSVIVDIDTAPPAQEWGLRFGDAVHNLRSALDHAVYGFAIADLDRDGLPDIAVARSDAPSVVYFADPRPSNSE